MLVPTSRPQSGPTVAVANSPTIEIRTDPGFAPIPFTFWNPQDSRPFDQFAYRTAMSAPELNRPDRPPAFVFAAACDHHGGFLIAPEHLQAFWASHRDASWTAHEAADDLRVGQAILGDSIDLYRHVEEGRVLDTLILHRLHGLATSGDTARGQSDLQQIARRNGVELPSSPIVDWSRQDVRVGLGRYRGHKAASIPTRHLEELARQCATLWKLGEVLRTKIDRVLDRADSFGYGPYFGYAGSRWLQVCVNSFGPLTHHVQLKASILMQEITANGVSLDRSRVQALQQRFQRDIAVLRERLRSEHRFFVDDANTEPELNRRIDRAVDRNPELAPERSSGGRWSTAAHDLETLSGVDPFFRDFLQYRSAKLAAETFLSKLNRTRLHAQFGYLLETGRTYSGGDGLSLQNLPNEDEPDPAKTIRGGFVPRPGHVFIDADYAQIELAVFARVQEFQFRRRSGLADLIRGGHDVHRKLAAQVLGKPEREVSADERSAAKAIAFGLPGGMGPNALIRSARLGYGIEITAEEEKSYRAAYWAMCPELRLHLKDEYDLGGNVAHAFGLTPAGYRAATGRPAGDDDVSWLGGMLLKVLGDAAPTTRGRDEAPPRCYEPREIDYFWDRAIRWVNASNRGLKADVREKLLRREPHFSLRNAVRDLMGRREVFTATGRLRANATYTASRNTIFQGPAADGAILGLWRLWRAGYRIVNFVHDQVVVETPESDLSAQIADIENLMRAGMQEAVPGVTARVRSIVVRSFNKNELVVLENEAPPAHAPVICSGQPADTGA
jgi:hypothetical protein